MATMPNNAIAPDIPVADGPGGIPMAHLVRESVTLTASAGGTGTAYLPSSGSWTGYIERIIYTKVDYADTVDFAITCESDGEVLWTESNVTASKIMRPVRKRQITTTGADSTLVESVPGLANDRVKISILQAGNATSGTFTVVFAGV